MLKHKNKYIAMLTVFVLLVGSLLAGCGSKETTSKTTAQKPSEYRIGVNLALSGSSAQTGIDLTDSIKMAADEINKAGGVDGVPLKIFAEDSQGTAEQGINAFNKLVQISNVPVVIVGWSAVAKAIAPLATQSKVAVISVCNAPDLSGSSPFLLNAYPLATVDVPATATYAYNTLGKRKAAVLYINNATGIGAAKIYKEIFEKSGGQVVAFESMEQNAIDVTTQVAKIRSANPDVIYLQLLPGEMVVALRKIQEMGLSAQLSSYSAAELMDVRKPSKDAIHGLIYPQMLGINDAGLEGFKAKFKKAYGREASSINYATWYYDNTYLVKDAIEYLNKKGWEYNGENLKKAILEIKTFDRELTGKIVFNEKGDISKALKIRRIVDWSDPSKDEDLATFEAK